MNVKESELSHCSGVVINPGSIELEGARGSSVSSEVESTELKQARGSSSSSSGKTVSMTVERARGSSGVNNKMEPIDMEKAVSEGSDLEGYGRGCTVIVVPNTPSTTRKVGAVRWWW